MTDRTPREVALVEALDPVMGEDELFELPATAGEYRTIRDALRADQPPSKGSEE